MFKEFKLHDPMKSLESIYYEGRLPNKSLYNLKMQHVWSSIPKSITKFYGELHNGFYYFPSRAMGLVLIERIAYFKEYECGILDDLNESLGINIDIYYGFFENGMGGYVAVDLNNCAENIATLWFTNDKPEYNVNFWDIIDGWIVIGLQDN